MKLSKTRMFFKFNKYSIIETLWSTASFIMDILILRHWGWKLSPVWYFSVLFIFFVFISLFGFFRAFISWRSYKVRKEDYIRATEIFEKYGVKKSILYNMQLEPCSQEVAKQLAEDFNVELDKIND